MTPSVNPESELLVKFNLAQDIISELFEAKATGKIQVLLMQCALSAKQLDPESYRKFIVHANSILTDAGAALLSKESELASQRDVIEQMREALVEGLAEIDARKFFSGCVDDGISPELRRLWLLRQKINDALALSSPVPTEAGATNKYDPAFGDERVCDCGHVYRRHFDTYANMAPIGCKYCPCFFFSVKL